MKLNTEDDYVYEIVLSVDQVRALLDLDLPEDLRSALDEVQAPVFDQETRKAYLVIEVKP